MQEVDTTVEVSSTNVPQEGNLSLTGGDDHQENPVNDSNVQEDTQPKCDINDEDVTQIMEIIAATGKFWHDWDTLKGILSNRLKQVLAEYPESQTTMGSESDKSSLTGKTYPELVKRMEEALLSFIDGPPFTLQRLCEILLSPKTVYPKLPKLALALEKNLLVTSTLHICTDPYPGKITTGLAELTQTTNVPEQVEVSKEVSSVQPVISCPEVDTDEEMIDAEGPEDSMSKDIEMEEDKSVEISDRTSGIPETDPSTEPCSVTNPVQSTGAET